MKTTYFYPELDDLELVDLFKQGDEYAYLEIYDRYKLLLQHHAYKKLGNMDDVEDILQELFTDLWKKRNLLVLDSSLAGYLYTAVRNRILNHLYRNKRKSEYQKSLAHFADAGVHMTDHVVREKELTALIERELNELPSRVREVFELSRAKGLSHKDIALQLGTSPQTVSKQISYALKVLRGRLGRQFIGN